MPWGVAAAVAGSVVSGAMAPDSSGGGSGNVAGGSYYDPYAAYRGKAASTLDSLIYGSPGTSGAPSGGQTYQQYLQGFQGGGGTGISSQGGTGHNSMGGWVQDTWGMGGSTGGGAQPLSESAWNAQNPRGSSQGGGSPTDIIKGMPGYQFGMNAGADSLNRTMAATGQTQSGGQQVALSEFGQKYAGSYYDKMINNLMGMSGATQSPMNVTGQNELNQRQGNLQASTMGSAISAGVTGLGQYFSNQASSPPPGTSFDPHGGSWY